MHVYPNYYKNFIIIYKNFSLIEYKFFFAWIYKKWLEKILFFENDGKPCTVIDLYLNHKIFFGHKDCYNYCDIDVDKILLFKKK